MGLNACARTHSHSYFHSFMRFMRSSTMLISFSSPADFSRSCTSSLGGSKAASRQREKMTRAFGHASGSFFFLRTTSFGDCTHMTAYFVVPTGADIIYTVEYRPERDISFQKNIFQSGERARAAKKYRPRAYAPVY